MYYFLKNITYLYILIIENSMYNNYCNNDYYAIDDKQYISMIHVFLFKIIFKLMKNVTKI